MAGSVGALKRRLDASIAAGDQVREAVAEEVAKTGHMDFGLAVASNQLRAQVDALRQIISEAGAMLLENKEKKCCGSPVSIAKSWSWWGSEQVTWAVALGGAMFGIVESASKVAGAVNSVSNILQGTFSYFGKSALNQRAKTETQITTLYEIQAVAKRSLRDYQNALTFYEIDIKVTERFTPQPGILSAAAGHEAKVQAIDADPSAWLVKEMQLVGPTSLLSFEELADRWLSKVPREILVSMTPFEDCDEGRVLEAVRQKMLGGLDVVEPAAGVQVQPSGLGLMEVVVEQGGDIDAATPELCISTMEKIISAAEAVGDSLRAVVARSAELTRSRSGNYRAIQEQFERHLNRVKRIEALATRVLSQKSKICGVDADKFKTQVLTVSECTTWVTNVAVGISSIFAENYKSLRILNLGFLLAQGTLSNFNSRVREGIAGREKVRGRYQRLRDDAIYLKKQFEGSLAILQGHNLEIERVESPELIAKALEERLKVEAASNAVAPRLLAKRLVKGLGAHVPTGSFSQTETGDLLRKAVADVYTETPILPRNE